MSRGFRAAVRDWAELGRVSNLPTIVSNVLMGAAIGAASINEADFPQAGDIGDLLAATAAVAVFYFAGMALNDVVDVSIDHAERPNRPLPSGRIRPGAAIAVIVWLFIIGLTLLGTLGQAAFAYGIALIAAIVAYDLLHARHAGAVVLMGLCRGLAYVVAAVAVTAQRLDWLMLASCVAGIMLYTILLTIVARSENEKALDRRRWLALLIPLAAAGPRMLWIPADGDSALIATAGGLMVLWLALAARHVFVRPPQTRRAVMAWLSGICLLDAFGLAWIGETELTWVALGCFAITALGHRRILGS